LELGKHLNFFNLQTRLTKQQTNPAGNNRRIRVFNIGNSTYLAAADTNSALFKWNNSTLVFDFYQGLSVNYTVSGTFTTYVREWEPLTTNGNTYLIGAIFQGTTTSSSILKWNGTAFAPLAVNLTYATGIEICNVPGAVYKGNLVENWIWQLNAQSTPSGASVNILVNDVLTPNLNQVIENGHYVGGASCFTFKGLYWIAFALGPPNFGMDVFSFVNGSSAGTKTWGPLVNTTYSISSSLWGTVIPSDLIVTTLNGDLTAVVACNANNSLVFRWTGTTWVKNGQTNITASAQVKHFQLDGVDYFLFASTNGNGGGALWRYNTFLKELDYVVSLDYDTLDFFTIGGTNWIFGGSATTGTIAQFLGF